MVTTFIFCLFFIPSTLQKASSLQPCEKILVLKNNKNVKIITHFGKGGLIMK